MKREDWVGAILFALILMALFAIPAHCNDDQHHYVLVFYNTEMRSITATKDTRLEFPMIDGHPDWNHGLLIKPLIDFDQKGGHYEKRNDQ